MDSLVKSNKKNIHSQQKSDLKIQGKRNRINVLESKKNLRYINLLDKAKGYLSDNCPDDAIQICKHLIKQRQELFNAYGLLAKIYQKQRDFDRLQIVIEEYHNEGLDRFHLINFEVACYLRRNEYDEAFSLLKHALRETNRDPNILYLYLKTHSRLGDMSNALFKAQELFRREPMKPKVNIEFARILQHMGYFDEAIKLLKTMIEKGIDPSHAYSQLAAIKSFKFSAEDVASMQELAENPELSFWQKVNIHQALGNGFENIDENDCAFKHYEIARKLRYSKKPYRAELIELSYHWTRRLLTKDIINSIKPSECTDASPIFVVGMHRSGSTLIDQILTSHSDVDGTMELPDMLEIAQQVKNSMGQYHEASQLSRAIVEMSVADRTELGEAYINSTKVHRKGNLYFVDKQPFNFENVGLILSILPNAKIIDARRNPADCAVSIFRQEFSLEVTHVNRMFDIGHYYQHYTKLMAHWDVLYPGKIHRVNYEEMIENSEGQIQQLLAFCGLPEDPKCYKFYDNNRVVRTPSGSQVKQPIYTTSVNQWQKFEKHLAPLYEALRTYE